MRRHDYAGARTVHKIEAWAITAYSAEHRCGRELLATAPNMADAASLAAKLSARLPSRAIAIEPCEVVLNGGHVFPRHGHVFTRHAFLRFRTAMPYRCQCQFCADARAGEP